MWEELGCYERSLGIEEGVWELWEELGIMGRAGSYGIFL